jgi:hypothetical protein
MLFIVQRPHSRELARSGSQGRTGKLLFFAWGLEAEELADGGPEACPDGDIAVGDVEGFVGAGGG